MAQTAEGTLETLVGKLAQIFPKFKRGTIRHSDQLTTERRINPKLRKQWFYTADSALYTVEDGEVILYLGRGPTNPIFKNIKKATHQLITTENYIPPKADIEAVVKAESTLKVKLSGLRLQGDKGLQGDNYERCYFEIKTADYDKLNPEQRRIAERVYGQGNDFKENMKMLNEAGIRTTRVYVLNPEYVKNNVPQDGAIARASGLDGFDSFDSYSGFNADGWYGGLHGGLRGVRKS